MNPNRTFPEMWAWQRTWPIGRARIGTFFLRELCHWLLAVRSLQDPSRTEPAIRRSRAHLNLLRNGMLGAQS